MSIQKVINSLWKRSIPKAKVQISSDKLDNWQEVYDALVKGIEELRRHHVDLAVLALYESEPSSNATGRWLTAGKDTNYHLFETFGEREQELVRNKKHYERIALARKNIEGVISYPDDGIEVYRRTRINPLLPKLKPESELNYVTEGGIYYGEDIKEFAKTAAKSGWTKATVEKAVRAGMAEYKDITGRLMHDAGVYKTLEQMEKVGYGPFELIIRDMRLQMAQAKTHQK